MTGDYSEEHLVEEPSISLYAELGWHTANCFHEFDSGTSTLGRETMADVVLVARLRKSLEKLNPQLPKEAIDQAIEEIARDRSTRSPVESNKEIYKLLKDGVKVRVRKATGTEAVETVKIIDWNIPANNDFFLASQFWVAGELYTRRADLIGFVNGIPLVFIELKASHKRLEDAFHNNLRDYKETIPQLFWHNAIIILSNGSQSRIGSITSDWRHFTDWKKIGNECEAGIVSLETMIRGTCEPSRLLDIVENFVLFCDVEGGKIKIVAKNHQYLGVNESFKAVQDIKKKNGRLGVFWHTQGAGKSYSMIFFSQKVLRKLGANHTFVILTDQIFLDNQIYKNFASSGAVTESEERVRAQSGEHLKELLAEDHRYIFTLIQKFRTDNGKKYPKLSDRSDIIVIADEAHRSQYDIFAMNMRNALPNAGFIAFTGTPLMKGEEKTREVFGDYITVYSFKQSEMDQATLPLYYENRVPELQLTNEDLGDDIKNVVDAAALDPDQESKLEKEFTREYHLITRDDRLEKIAQDIVEHFMGRGYMGKAMVISIDRFTAVKMYDKVQKYWKQYIEKLEKSAAKAEGKEKAAILDRIRFMKETDMAVVISSSQNEIADFKEKSLDILPHRKRMKTEDLDTNFKKPEHPFRIAFLCAMWNVGFDAPCCSTIYLDKPMQNHTLMQTIARVNRVFGERLNGLIIDYIGIFRNLQKALAVYGWPKGFAGEGEMPIKDKSQLVEALTNLIEEAATFCADKGLDIERIISAEGFEKVNAMDDAVEAILVNDESKLKFLSLASMVHRTFRAILPDTKANEFAPYYSLFSKLAEKIRSLVPEPDISGVMEKVEDLLDDSVTAEGYVIRERGKKPGKEGHINLAALDFEKLRVMFKTGHKRTEAEILKGIISGNLQRLGRLNKTRAGFIEKFQQLIDEYNSGSKNVEHFFNELVEFARELSEEEKRAISEGLTEEELAIVDLLTKPEIKLTNAEEKEVKKVARELLDTLKNGKLVLDWRKRQQTRAAVLQCIQVVLDNLPSAFGRDVYARKCNLVYQHVYESYFGEGRSVYSA